MGANINKEVPMKNCEDFIKKDHNFQFASFVIEKTEEGWQSIFALSICTKCASKEMVLIKGNQVFSFREPKNAPFCFIEE